MANLPSSTSLILGGGGARGFAHIGVIRYLQEHDTTITDIAGTSMGACIGSCLACGIPMNEVTDIVKQISYSELIDFDTRTGVIRGDKLSAFFKKIFGDRDISDADIPLTICATRLVGGAAKYFTSGPIRQALRASTSLPGVFSPAHIDDEDFVDGGLTHNLPINKAQSSRIIAVSVMKDLSPPIERSNSIRGVSLPRNRLKLNFDILRRSLSIMLTAQEDHLLATTNKEYILVRPKIKSIGLFDIKEGLEAIDIGWKEAQHVMSQ